MGNVLLLGWARPRASFIAITFSAVCGGGEMVPPRRSVTIDVFAVKQDESLKVALDGVRAFATAHGELGRLPVNTRRSRSSRRQGG